MGPRFFDTVWLWACSRACVCVCVCACVCVCCRGGLSLHLGCSVFFFMWVIEPFTRTSGHHSGLVENGAATPFRPRTLGYTCRLEVSCNKCFNTYIKNRMVRSKSWICGNPKGCFRTVMDITQVSMGERVYCCLDEQKEEDSRVFGG